MMAFLSPIKRLNKVDFPTFGLPTMAMMCDMQRFLLVQRYEIISQGKHAIQLPSSFVLKG
jgi:hypothetical protein